MKLDDLKKVIAKLIRENFHQSISEATYDLGKKQYTDKNLTPTEILDLAMAYASTSANKMLSGKLGNMVNVANDLAKLNGTTQLDAKTRGKNPALILFLLKNKLVTKDEYIKLYKDLIEKQISVVKSLKNADPASRMVGGAAARAAHKDMRGEFDESVNEMSRSDVHFKAIMKMYDRGGSFTKKKVAVVVCKNPKASKSDIEEELLDSDYSDIIQYQDELNIYESVNGGINDKTHKTDTDSEDNFLKQHKNSMSTPHIGYPAELDTYDFDDTRKKEGGYQSDIQDTEDKGYEPVKESTPGERIQNLNNRIKALRDKMNSTKSSTQKNLIQQRLKNALQSLSKIKSGLGIKKINNESINEAASVEAMGIAALTGLRGDAVQKFIDDNNIHARKLFAYLKIKGPNTLSNRMDISTAIVGKANNKFAQGIIKAFSESVVNEAKFEVYHNSYTSAINAAREYAEKQGYTINDDDAFTKIGMGPRKPSEGKTNKFSIELSKDGKVQRKQLHIQVYGMKTKYELNCYIG